VQARDLRQAYAPAPISSTSRSRSKGLAFALLPGGGQHDDRRGLRARQFAQLRGGADAVQARHVEVQEDDDGRLAGGELHRLQTVGRLDEVEARDVLQRRCDELADERVVVDD
jgi:hypothetical protein